MCGSIDATHGLSVHFVVYVINMKLSGFSLFRIRGIEIIIDYSWFVIFFLGIYVLAETGTAFVKMAAAAEKDGLLLIVDSGYRSASYQTEIIKRRLADGEEPETILSFVAPPGYSEHETGRAVDLVPSDASFAETPAYRWMKANAAGFGFYESYPESTADSIPWEPSHWLYRTLEATR